MSQWFETTPQYSIDDALGERQWPQSLALVRVKEQENEQGEMELKTQSGWGKEFFGWNYDRNRFRPDRILREFVEDGKPFGIVMRSLPMVCVDIDGKNGGIQMSSIMRLPPTLAETSKSGNGYHLFYRVPEAVWDPKYGYQEFGDANGIVPGVDIRAVGIVYHYPQQRWNGFHVADMPQSLRRLLEQRRESQEIERARKEHKLEGSDLAIAQEQVLERLAGKITEGKRNQTLYAIGCDMRLYQVKDWEQHLIARALMIGLDETEARSIVKNVKRYA